MKVYTLSTISPRVKDFSPKRFIESFGIEFLNYEITSLAETIIFNGCTNVPEHPYQLPYYIHVIETLEAEDKVIKSVELIVRPENRSALVTYNESKEIVSIEHGQHFDLKQKFNQIHQQIIIESEQSYLKGIVITENNRKKVRKNLFKKRSDGTNYQIEYNKPNTSEWVLLPSAVYCVVGNKYRLTKVKQ